MENSELLTTAADGVEKTVNVAAETVNVAGRFFKNLWKAIKDCVTPDLLTKMLTILIGVFVLTLIYIITKKVFKKISGSNPKIKQKTSEIILKIWKYLFFVVMTVFILGIFGIKLTALFGAAGIAGVAVGFAAQTSFSNIISGFFLLSEHALKVGDFIVIGDTSGIVDSIDMLSIRIHTLDNQMIRIPNESIIKSNLQNNSFFSIRRITIDIDVPYEKDLQKSLDVLASVPARCPLVLTEPAPLAFCNKFSNSGVTLTLAVWLNKDDFIAVKNQVFVEILKVFDEAKVCIPYQQIVIRGEKA